MSDGEHARWVREFFDNDTVAFGHVDSRLRIRTVNRAMAALDGSVPHECIGRPLRDLLPPVLGERVERWLAHVRDTGEPVVDVRLDGEPGPDGSPKAYLASYYPIDTAEGRGVGSAVIALDGPTLAALDHGTPRFRALAASLPEPVFRCGRDGAMASTAWREALEREQPLQIECRLRLAARDGGTGTEGASDHDWYLLHGLRRPNVAADRADAWTAIATRIGTQKTREQRLRTLVEVARAITTATAPNLAIDAVADVLVPGFADFVVCMLGAPEDVPADDAAHAPAIELRVARDWSAEREAVLRECIARLPGLLPPGHPAGRAAASGEPVLVPNADRAIERGAVDATHVEARRRIGAHSVIFVPLRVEDRLIGVLSLGRTRLPRDQAAGAPAKARFGEHDVEFARDVGRQAASTIDRLQRYRAAQDMLARMRAEARRRDRLVTKLARELSAPVDPLLAAARQLQDGEPTPTEAARIGEGIATQAHRIARGAEALLEAALLADAAEPGDTTLPEAEKQ